MGNKVSLVVPIIVSKDSLVGSHRLYILQIVLFKKKNSQLHHLSLKHVVFYGFDCI